MVNEWLNAELSDDTPVRFALAAWRCLLEHSSAMPRPITTP